MQSLHVVNLGYSEEVLPCTGFGYLVPTIEKERILGVVFDSKIFPQQNLRPKETRLTVMMRENSDPLKTAVDAVSKHLGVWQVPCVHQVFCAPHAIPQFELGHLDKVNAIKKKLENLPRLKLIGNYLSGVSVSDCIESAKTLASDLCQSVSTSTS
jgi:oxygen-dependent protoporphyrinogen oxidase